MTTDPTGTGAIPQEAVDDWREDGTGKRLVDGSPSTCDSAFNRGYDAGYCEGMKAGVPPIRLPRWDADPTVLRFGWLDGRCGNCGEESSQIDRLTADLAAARQQLDAVRALHTPYEHDNGLCRGCEQLVCRTRDLLADAPTDAPATKDGQ